MRTCEICSVPQSTDFSLKPGRNGDIAHNARPASDNARPASDTDTARPASDTARPASDTDTGVVADYESGMIDLFVRMAGVIGQPRSVGEIYGLLFVSDEPLCIEDFMDRLNISKGSVSQGLRTLRAFGAVKPTYLPGERKDYYLPETELKKLAAGFARDEVIPHLESGVLRLAALEQTAGQLPKDRQHHARERLAKLESWHSKASKIFPFLLKMLGDPKTS